MLIVGAGMAGCLAGIINREAKIIDQVMPNNTHQALFRLKTPDIGEETGIPLKQVKVFKGISYHKKFVQPDPRMIALYSRKVVDCVSERSIANIDTVIRWIPPFNFHELLFEMVKDRFETRGLSTTEKDKPIISTIPMPVLARIQQEPIEAHTTWDTIYVNKYIVSNCDYYATIYYPHPEIDVYRATINGNILILESTYPLGEPGLNITEEEQRCHVLDTFGLTGCTVEHKLKDYKQSYGKLIPLNKTARNNFIAKMTDLYEIYSLGRFATWRNILLDDVLKDIHVINSLISKDYYGRRIAREY